jgi:hypothetical protein
MMSSRCTSVFGASATTHTPSPGTRKRLAKRIGPSPRSVRKLLSTNLSLGQNVTTVALDHACAYTAVKRRHSSGSLPCMPVNAEPSVMTDHVLQERRTWMGRMIQRAKAPRFKWQRLASRSGLRTVMSNIVAKSSIVSDTN